MQIVVPILQPATWQPASDVLVRPFVPGLTGSPLLALYRPDGDTMRYVGAEEVAHAAELEREAFDVVAGEGLAWREVVLEMDIPAVALAHSRASEALAVEAIMLGAHAALGDDVVAAIPRRGMLIATAGKHAATLARFVERALAQPSPQPVLTTKLFGIRAGRIAGLYSTPEPDGVSLPSTISVARTVGPRASIAPDPGPAASASASASGRGPRTEDRGPTSSGFGESLPAQFRADRIVPAYRSQFASSFEGQQLPVFALLVAPDWPNRATHACRPLIAGLDEPGVPLVAPVYLLPQPEGPPDRAFLANDRLPGPVDAIAQEAYANIAMRPLPWLPKDVRGHQIIFCLDDYLAAEHVLVPGVLADLTRELGGGPIVVGMPHRGQLVATSFAPFERGDDFADHFQLYVREAHAQAGSLGITQALFVVANGALAGVMA